MNNPWLTSGILESIDRNHKYSKMQKKGLIPRNIYTAHRNKLNNLIRLVKRRYYKNKFESCLNDVRSTWKNINLLLNKKREKLPSNMYIGEDKFSNSRDICEAFANYLSEIATSLDKNIPSSNESYNCFLNNSNINSMFLSETSDNEVKKVINSFKNKGSSVNEIPTKIFKIVSSNICEILGNLFNQSIQQGIFPDCLKVARVVPIFKEAEGDKLNMENYRPISTLNFISKVFEKLFLTRLKSFLNLSGILDKFQFGFRDSVSTTDAVITFLNDTYNNINESKYTIATFIDFKKAFDTINHEILLGKLKNFGVRSLPLKWIESYLYNRRMYVDFNGTHSTSKTVNIGIPQGTVLGPFLFILYINDIFNSSKILKFLLYADDTTIYLSGHNLKSLFEIFNNELQHFYLWTKVIELQLILRKLNL